MRKRFLSAASLGLLAVVGLGGMAGCDDHCAELEVKVCEKLKDKKKCEIIKDPARRELLGDDACKSMLKAQPR